MIFGAGKKVQEAKNQAKADYDRAVNSSEDSKQERAFKLKIGLRVRSCIDKIFIEGAEKFGKYAEVCVAAIANDAEKPEPPKSSPFQKIKSVNGQIYAYLPEEQAEYIFLLGGKYQNVEIDARTAIRRAQVIANQISYDIDLDNKLIVLQFLRDELEQEGNPFDDEEEISDDEDDQKDDQKDNQKDNQK